MTANRRSWPRATAYLLPFLVGTAIFTVYPIVYLLIVAFQEDYNILTREFSQFGLSNFEAVLRDPDFGNAARNTALYTVIVVPVTISLGLAIASLLARIRFLRPFYQTALFLPLVTSSVAIGMVWKYIYNADYGLLNFLLSTIGLDPVNWLNDPRWNMPALVIFGVWSALPFTILIFVAALQSIGEQYYTAARIDGATVVQRFFRITVPLMGSTIGLVAVLNLIDSSKVFSELFPLFNGSPGAGFSLYTVVYYIYEQLSAEWDLGRAAAASLLLFAAVLVLTLLQAVLQRTRRRRS
ncbi:sugar ABC transporter permease [Calidifontibacter sp. DB0510]|uniref:Sugar ABC transporter permease n=1 Tax=Metallococcus carri TaxID=1656884 RepID=A0A967B215_9MICO|nr:sugar ABC transporter permease [Metallococcus carri]NHN56858.1 sugar ABC transporter permease [Metallococcus carri]NOP37765.1 sugar ABC transporter permease [Calidifontibacter sp. DB2511S]